MERTESQENYLEVILILSKKKPVVRAVDIANELGFNEKFKRKELYHCDTGGLYLPH